MSNLHEIEEKKNLIVIYLHYEHLDKSKKNETKQDFFVNKVVVL